MQHPSTIVYPHVRADDSVTIGAYCILGEWPAEAESSPPELTVGQDAVIRSHTVIYAGNTIGSGFHTGHSVLVREYNTIGDDVSIGSHSVVEHHCTIGSRVRLHSNVFVPEYTVLEEDCWLGPGVILTNAKYPRSPNVKNALQGPLIGAHAKLGAGCVILPGVRIGKHALVGAGAIVSREVPDHGVVQGEPARLSKYLQDLPYVES
jgi:acetyltransferase-like isoleucine patch superfamily enzyme